MDRKDTVFICKEKNKTLLAFDFECNITDAESKQHNKINKILIKTPADPNPTRAVDTTDKSEKGSGNLRILRTDGKYAALDSSGVTSLPRNLIDHLELEDNEDYCPYRPEVLDTTELNYVKKLDSNKINDIDYLVKNLSILGKCINKNQSTTIDQYKILYKLNNSLGIEDNIIDKTSRLKDIYLVNYTTRSINQLFFKLSLLRDFLISKEMITPEDWNSIHNNRDNRFEFTLPNGELKRSSPWGAYPDEMYGNFGLNLSESTKRKCDPYNLCYCNSSITTTNLDDVSALYSPEETDFYFGEIISNYEQQ